MNSSNLFSHMKLWWQKITNSMAFTYNSCHLERCFPNALSRTGKILNSMWSPLSNTYEHRKLFWSILNGIVFHLAPQRLWWGFIHLGIMIHCSQYWGRSSRTQWTIFTQLVILGPCCSSEHYPWLNKLLLLPPDDQQTEVTVSEAAWYLYKSTGHCWGLTENNKIL